MNKPIPGDNNTDKAYTELERGVYAALETYSNVHRGSGHNSLASTYLYEQARDIILEYLKLNKNKYVVIFCTPRRAEILKGLLHPESYQCISSNDIGLPLGVRAMAVDKKALPRGTPFQTGGGTTRVVSRGWVIWSRGPEKFEAGTPAIINIIAFARALQLMHHYGKDIFRYPVSKKMTATEILYHDELKEFSGRKLLDELRQVLIGQGTLVPTLEGDRPYINLDYAASTPTFAPIWNTVCQTWRRPGQIQQEIIHEVKSICADVLNAPRDSYDVIFTSNTTEAINLVADGLHNECEKGTETVLLNTLLEHNSNDLPWRMVPHNSLIRLPVDSDGFINLNELDTILCTYNKKNEHGKKRIRLVAVSGASNVLGVFNNLAEISRIVHQNGARLLVDAAQLVAHRKVEMEQWGIDYLAFSAHKVYAPFGSGVLIVRKGLLKFSVAEMELIQSSGEENAGGIAALGKSLLLLQRIGLDLIQEEEKVLTERALIGLTHIPDLTIYGIKDPNSPGFAQKGGVIVFSLKKIYSDRIAKELAERCGIGIRYGCHCSHLLVKHLVNISPFLERFQGLILILFPKITLPGVARVSLGIPSNENDIDTLIQVMDKIARQPSSYRTPISIEKNLKQKINDFIRNVAQRVYV